MPSTPAESIVAEGFATFAAREWPRLVGALDLLCGSPAVAEELAQEALIRAYERWPSVANLEAPGGWTHRVALNLARSHLRRRQAERRAHDRLATSGDHAELGTDPSTLAVREAVSQLPTKLRSAVVLRYFSGLTVREAAAVLHLTPAALRTRTHRALAALRDQLPLDGPEDEQPAVLDAAPSLSGLARRQVHG
jgi:RNA polymerase sigma factor (sigma-70 family)